jgi:hypothetical protein
MSLNILLIEKYIDENFDINIKKEGNNLSNFIVILQDFREVCSKLTIYKEHAKYFEMLTDLALNYDYVVEEYIFTQPTKIQNNDSVVRRFYVTNPDTLIEGNHKDIAEIFVNSININILINITNVLVDKGWNVSFNWLGHGNNQIMCKYTNPLILTKNQQNLVQEIFNILKRMKKDKYPIVNQFEYLSKYSKCIDRGWHCSKPGLYFLDINGTFLVCPDVKLNKKVSYTENSLEQFNNIWIQDSNRRNCNGCYWRQCVEYNIESNND